MKTKLITVCCIIVFLLLLESPQVSAAELIIPSDGVQGFEYDYPINTEIAQQADSQFDGWAILGSNATRSASLQLDVRRKSRYIKVYSELGMRSDGVTKGSTVLSRDFFATGVFVIEFDVNFYNGVGNISFKNTGATSWEAGHTAISVGTDRRDITVTNGALTEVLIPNFSELKWYSFKIITNTLTKQYSIQAYDGDNLVGELLFLDYAITNGVQATGMRNMNVFLPDQAVDQQILIDNVKIYYPEVAQIAIRATGNGLQIPEASTNKLELVARAYDSNGLEIPGFTFDWSLAERAVGVSLEAPSAHSDSIYLVANPDAIAKPITVTATTSGIKETITIPLTSSSIGIELLGSSSILIPFVEESSFEYQAVVRDKAGQIMPDQSVTWYLYDQNNLERIEHQGITLNLQTGELMIRDNTQPGIFTVRAVLNSDNVVTASKQVAIHSLKYDFGSEQAQVGYTKVTPTTYYSPELGYGIDPLTPVKAHVIDANRILEGDYIYNDRYFRFQQKLPPGNYQVKITFVDDNPNHIIVAAENVPTQRFRSNQYYDNRLIKGSTSFNGRGEINFQVAVVDGVLDLEIFGDHVKTTQYKAMITALEITKLPLPEASDRPTVHLIGDSTVQGYSAADVMAGWGQMIGEFFGANYSVNNAGIGGRSSASFYREGRLENILLAIKPGDIVLVQLGHNDGTYNNEARYTSNEDYERLYREYYLPGIKQRGATAVVITPVPMHGFTSTSGLGSYVNSAKQVAHATDTFIIDAHNLALDHYNNLPGTQAEKLAVLDTYYVLNKKGGSDYTHFTKPGARKMAELIYHGLVDLGIIKAD